MQRLDVDNYDHNNGTDTAKKRRRNGKVDTYDNKNDDENAMYDCAEDKNGNDNDISDGTTMTNSTTRATKNDDKSTRQTHPFLVAGGRVTPAGVGPQQGALGCLDVGQPEIQGRTWTSPLWTLMSSRGPEMHRGRSGMHGEGPS